MRHLLLSVCIVFAIVLPSQAQGEKPKAVDDGWIQLFDGAATFGWAGKCEVAKPKNEDLEGKALRLSVVGDEKSSGAIRGTTAFQEFELSVTYATPHVGAAILYLVPADAKEHNAKMDRFVLPGTRSPTTASFTVTNESYRGKTR